MDQHVKVFPDILATVGNTPMVRLNKVVSDIPAAVFAKLEPFNPGHSTKDRIAIKMLSDAEQTGKIKPGGTIIECTSGNTGMGLAIAAAVKGYKCIFTTNDKQSKEKIDLLKALGAEVIICPTNVHPKDEKSYYSVAQKLSRTIPNSFWFNQYENLSNTQAHFESTGPEIWKQTEGKITHLVAGVGTGGTISGTGRYLKQKNPAIQVWGIDTYGSVFKKYHETGIFDEKEIYPYITEGIGEDILPSNVDFSVIDHFEKVTDKDGALLARQLARQEGILMGYSAGSALAGLIQMKSRLTAEHVVVIVFPDHGSRYVGKIYNDEWMRERGFLETELHAKDLVGLKPACDFVSTRPGALVMEVVRLMKEKDISQIPVMDGPNVVGTVGESQIIRFLSDRNHNLSEVVESIMVEPLPEVPWEALYSEISRKITRQMPAVLTRDKAGVIHIITQYDLIQNL